MWQLGNPPTQKNLLKIVVAARHDPDSYPGREIKGCDEGSYTKNQPNPNLTLPIAQ